MLFLSLLNILFTIFSSCEEDCLGNISLKFLFVLGAVYGAPGFFIVFKSSITLT